MHLDKNKQERDILRYRTLDLVIWHEREGRNTNSSETNNARKTNSLRLLAELQVVSFVLSGKRDYFIIIIIIIITIIIIRLGGA